MGQQSLSNCFVWSTIYGLATFYAARKSQTPPTSPDLQAGPDYAYVRYELANKVPANTCLGGNLTKCLDWLRSNGGTPSLAAAPNADRQHSRTATCGVDWSDYGSREIPPDPRFLIPAYKTMKITGADGLKNLRAVIASGLPVAYGTSYYTDFNHYKGKPSPYVGNGELRKDTKGQPKGHAMLIIGYDDARGAVRIQNSHGTSFGDTGFVWMAYGTLEKLAEGTGFYVPDPA
ncbi:MAG: C1 family peptidase [Mycobacterium sp.]